MESSSLSLGLLEYIMEPSFKKLEEILITLKETHKYHLNQNDLFTQRSQFIFVVIALYLNVAFINVNIESKLILILKFLLLLLLGLAALFALPILRKSGYRISPKIDTFPSNFISEKYDYKQLLLYLIENYKISIKLNRIKNDKRYGDIFLSMFFLALSTLIIILILVFYALISSNHTCN
jgi:hypothetical protein